jgi:Zn-dependent protease with chaperone function
VYVTGLVSQVFKVWLNVEMSLAMQQLKVPARLFSKHRQNLLESALISGLFGTAGWGIVVLVVSRRWIGGIWESVSGKMSTRGPRLRSAVYLTCISLIGSILGWMNIPFSLENENFNLVGAIIWNLLLGLLFYQLAKREKIFVGFAILVILRIGFAALCIYISPVMIRNTMDPMPTGVLLDSLAVVSEQFNLSRSKILLWPGSDNAGYIGGFCGDELIILGSDLFSVPKEQLVAVIAHEMGHRQHGDYWVKSAIMILPELLSYALAFFVVLPNPAIFSAFGFTMEPLVGALPVSGLLASAIRCLWMPLERSIGIYMEFRADAMAAKLGLSSPLAQFLTTAGEHNQYTATLLYEYLYMDHPPTVDRAVRLLERH